MDGGAFEGFHNGWDADYPETGAVLENVPLDGEDGVSPVMPTSVHDDGHLVGVRQRQRAQATAKLRDDQGADARAALRRQRFTAIFDRIIYGIEDRHLLPESWLSRTSESGERYPRFVCVVRDNYWRCGTSFAAAISFVASLLWLVQWALGAPSTVMHDGTNVVNMYSPSTIYTVDLTSDRVSTWLGAHRPEMYSFKGADLRAGYFSADIYHASERRNITFDWLGPALHDACQHGSEDMCVCMPAVEIGVLANAIFVEDGTIMLNPHITKQSEQRFSVTYNDGTKASQPVAAVVEYMHRDGVIDRRKETLQRVACIIRALDLVGVLER